MGDLVVTVLMLGTFVVVALVIVHILRNRDQAPELPSERSHDQVRAETRSRGHYESGMGPMK